MKPTSRITTTTLMAAMTFLTACISESGRPLAAHSQDTAGWPAIQEIKGGRASPSESLGGTPTPHIQPDCRETSEPDPGKQCPVGTLYFGEGSCDDVSENAQRGCQVLTFETACGETATALCLEHEPDESHEVCDDYDNDRDGLIDEDANCPERVEHCGPYDEDGDGKIDEGLDCTIVERIEGAFPCDSPNDYDERRRRGICPEEYVFTDNDCDGLAASQVSNEACIKAEEIVCGEKVTATCALSAYWVADAESVSGQTAPITCSDSDDLALDGDEICGLAGLEQVIEGESPRCWLYDAHCLGCPPRRNNACIDVQFCQNGKGHSVMCALPE